MAPVVTVLVPYRPDGTDRAQAWEYVQAWWRQQHPGWQLVAGTCPDGWWCKATAVADALDRADGDLLVVADADVVCPEVDTAVRQVATGRAPWAIPHGMVFRLTEAASRVVYAGALPASQRSHVARAAYLGTEGGGITVLPRATYEQVPLDPRFRAWGQEDEAWALALNTLAGRRWRGDAPLWHLWHPPMRRTNGRVGNDQGWALWHRYETAARREPGAMRALLDEAMQRKGTPVEVLGPGWDDTPTWTGGGPSVLFESLKYRNLDLSNKPGLHGVKFVDGYCEVSRPNAISILQSPWWLRRGVRVVDGNTPQPAGPVEPVVVTYPPTTSTPEPAPDDGAAPPEQVPTGTAGDVLAWVADDPAKARQALDAEHARDKPRTTLATALTKLAGVGSG